MMRERYVSTVGFAILSMERATQRLSFRTVSPDQPPTDGGRAVGVRS